jgi:hypothetical protein
VIKQNNYNEELSTLALKFLAVQQYGE